LILSKLCKLFLVNKFIYSAYLRAIDSNDRLWTKLQSAYVTSKQIGLLIFLILAFLVLFICKISVIVQLNVVIINFLGLVK